MSEEDWLSLRTAALARPRDLAHADDAVDEGQARLAVLRVTAAGGRYDGVDLRWLRAVRTLRRLARLPQAPAHVAGLVGHEGVVLPVFHLAAVLGAPLAALPERGQALILGREGDLVAVAVDEVGETRELAADEIREVPTSVSERLRSVLLGATDDGLLLLDSRRAPRRLGDGRRHPPSRECGGTCAREPGSRVSFDPLNDLRAIFWDEVEDALETLDREGLTLAPTVALDETSARARFDEAYRLVHSLKGAARAVGFGDIESLCHAAEEHLGSMAREASSLGVAPVFESDAARVSDALRGALNAARASSQAAQTGHATSPPLVDERLLALTRAHHRDRERAGGAPAAGGAGGGGRRGDRARAAHPGSVVCSAPAIAWSSSSPVTRTTRAPSTSSIRGCSTRWWS